MGKRLIRFKLFKLNVTINITNRKLTAFNGSVFHSWYFNNKTKKFTHEYMDLKPAKDAQSHD